MSLLDLLDTTSEDKAAAKNADEREKFLSDPSKIDKAVANMADYLSPTASTKKPRGETYGTDTVEASKSGDDPTRGFGTTLRSSFTSALMDPRYKDIPAGQLLHHLSEGLMQEKDETGMSKLERAYHYMKTEGSRMFGGTLTKDLPGFAAWDQDQRVHEKQKRDKESWLPSAEDLATGTGVGAAFGLAGGLAGGGIAGALAGAGTGLVTGAALGGPIGAAAGTVLGGIGGFFGGEATGAAAGTLTGALMGLGGELLAPAAKKLIHSTDWYQGMISSNSAVDRVKAMGADIAAYAPGAMIAGAGIGKAAEGVGRKLETGLGAVGKEGANVTGLGGQSINGMTGEALGIAKPGLVPKPSMQQTLIGYDSSRMTTPGGGTLYDEAGRTVMSPAMEGESIMGGPGQTTPLLPPGTDAIPMSGVEAPKPFESQVQGLLGGGKGYEWPGSKNLNRAEGIKANEINPLDFGPNTPGELDDAGRKSFESFKPLVKNYFGDQPVTDQEMFNIWKQRSDNTAAANVEAAVQRAAKVKADLAQSPKASTLLEVSGAKGLDAKPVPGSNIVEQSQELSPRGLQEAGLEPVTDPGVTPLSGPLSQKIPMAAERDSFAKIAAESNDGEMRTAIAKNSENELKAVKTVNADEAADALTEIKQTVSATPKDQETAINNVNKHVEGGAAVEEEYFPETKPQSLSELSQKYFQAEYEVNTPAERAAMAREEAVLELKSSEREVNEENISKTIESILRDETDNFKDWLKQNDIKPPKEMKVKGFDINNPGGGANHSLINGMAAFIPTALLATGAGVLYDHLSDKTADAGWLTASVETVAKKAAILSSAMDKHLISETVQAGQTVMKANNWQTGIKSDPAALGKIVNESIRSGSGAGTQYALMSPYQVAEALFKTGMGKMVNVATNLASFVTAGSRTSENAKRVFTNIMDAGGFKTHANAIKEATAPLVPLSVKSAHADMTTAELKTSERILASLLAKPDLKDPAGHAGDVETWQKSITALKAELQGLGGATKTFHDAHAEVMKDLVGKYPEVKIALSLEDPKRQIYPWLEPLTRAEEVTAGQTRGLLDQYMARLKDRGIDVRENYLPHSPHPDLSKAYNAEMENTVGGAAYQKFYSRTENSRPLLPDLSYTMNHYLSDVEPRIQNHDFWVESGWNKIRESTIIQSNPGLKRAFDQLYEGSKPMEQTWGNIAAQRYSEFEAVNKLFLNPSAGLKHIVKMAGDVVSVGPTVVAKSLPDTLSYVGKKMLDKTFGMNQTSVQDVLEKLGVKSDRFNRTIMDDFMDSAIMSGNARKFMFDMGIDDQQQIFNTAKNMWKGVQNVGATWINLAELIDRGTSVSSALQMAGKKGMTVEQAMYGSYDLILKNNFLFNQFNPQWLNNPKIRAFLMFQATPFKIMERRVVNAQRSFENVKQLSTEMQKIVKEPGGWDKVTNDIKNMSAYMRDGQSELKSNLFIDTLRNETDFFGTPVVRQLATDMMTIGAATYGGAQVGLALGDHFFHIPFLSTQSEKGRAELAVSPLVSSTMKGYNAWKNKGPGEDFLLGSIMKRWLGPYGPLPQTLGKAVKLHNGDIPEIYQRGGSSGYLKYLFGVPGKE